MAKSIDPATHDPSTYGGKPLTPAPWITAVEGTFRDVKGMDWLLVRATDDVPPGLHYQWRPSPAKPEHISPMDVTRLRQTPLLQKVAAPKSDLVVFLPTQDDPRILARRTSGGVEWAVIRSHDSPEGVKRGVGVHGSDPVAPSQFDNAFAEVYPYASTPGYRGDIVKVKVDDLRDLGWPLAHPLTLPPAKAAAYPRGNSGRKYEFETGTNAFTGEIGWKPIALATGTGKDPGFDPVNAVMTVHDLMEHFPDSEYGPHNEYMAQGAMLWLRFEGDFFGNHKAFDELDLYGVVVKPAFGMLFHHIVKGKLETKVYAGEEQSSPTSLPLEAQFILAKLQTGALEYVRVNHLSYDKALLQKSIINGIPWIVRGYHLAAERYRGLDKKRLVRLYRDVVERIKGITKGAHLALTLDYDKYTAEIEIANKVTVA